MELDFSTDTIEKLLFKKTLTDKRYLNILSGFFEKRWIKTKNLGVLFKIVLNYYAKYNTTPTIKLVSALVKKFIEKYPENSDLNSIPELLRDISSMDLSIPENVLSSNLKEYIRKRALYCVIFDNIEKLDGNSDEVVDSCLTSFDKVQKIVFADSDLGLNYFNEAAMNDHWDFILNPAARLPTGWQTLDFYTNGGIYRDGKCLSIIMAGPGLGKSLWLSNLAVNFLRQNLSVVVISLEMSQNIYAQRFDAHISEDDINHLKETSDTSISKIKNFYTTYPKSNLFIKEYPPNSIKCQDIDQYLENIKQAGFSFDVVIVDYLNLILPQVSKDNMFLDGKNVSENLRALSYKYNVPVMTAVQANTEGINNENIEMRNVSESRGIAHTADALFALYQMPDDRENGIIKCRILKNRFGGFVGKCFQYKLDSKNLVLKDISLDNDVDSDSNNADENLKKLVANIPSISTDLIDL